MSMLEIKNITKIYDSNKSSKYQALSSVSYSFSNTGLVSIVGESGSGKSTLLNILSLLDSSYSGEYFISGQNVNSWSKKKKRKFILRNIGIVFQQYHLLEEHTVIFNIMLPALMLGESNKRAKQKAIALLDSIEFNKNLYTSKVKDLSGGEKQRICLLRTLINDPNIIFADEPTGALDSENSCKIMNILKDASKTRLVVMVSHNLDLVNQYSDAILFMADGKIVSTKTINEINAGNTLVINKRKPSDKWIEKISFSNFKRRFNRDFVSIFTTTISLLACILALVFVSEVDEISLKESSKHLDLGVATIAKETQSSISNGLVSIVNTTRPNEKEIKTLSYSYPSYSFELNYDVLLPQYADIYINGELLNETAFKPIYNFNEDYVDKSLLLSGSLPNDDSFSDVVVNKSMFNLLGNTLNAYINVKYRYEETNTDVLTGDSFNDYFIFDKTFRVIGVVDEQTFLQTPTVYYSFTSLDLFISNYTLINYSNYYGYTYTWKDRVQNAANNEAISSYSYRIFAKRNSSIIELQDNIDSNLVIESNSQVIAEAFSKIIEGVTYGLWIFVGIAFIGTVLIIGIISFSSYTEDKKRIAILKAMGASDEQIASIYINENILIAALSINLSGVLFTPISKFAFNLVNRFTGIEVVVGLNKDFLIICFLMTLIILFVATISIYIPIIFGKRVSVSKELIDE